MYYHIVCKTLTNAQRMSRLLDKSRIPSHIKRLPSSLREQNGCGYAVRVKDEHFGPSISVLKSSDIAPLRVYKNIEDGAEEVQL